ncbi:MAG: hypothetical protein COB02_03155 [Candidatus Cloacimonadota bacterium]|nr:MAG: hypothetical protein COB02_03155 [Candidatus Cloacimonadota bacterium]
MKKSIIFLLIFSLLSLPNASPLLNLLSQDSFYNVKKIRLQEMSLKQRQLEYSKSLGFKILGDQLDRNSKESQLLAKDWVLANTPLGLVSYALKNNFKVQHHFGSLYDSYYFLKKEGIKEVYYLYPFYGDSHSAKQGILYLVVPPTKESRGQLILTNIRDDQSIQQVLSYFYCYREGNNFFLDEKISGYDFHVADRVNYKSSLFKESLYNLPKDIKRVIFGKGKQIFSRLLERKFASMSLDFLKGLYGTNFLKVLKRTFIEEGYFGVDTWKVSKFSSLQNIKSNFLSKEEYKTFKIFEKDVLVFLKQKKEHRLYKTLIIGNGLSIHKSGLRKIDLSKRFIPREPIGVYQSPFMAIFPMKNGDLKERVLFFGGVEGDALRELCEVLNKIGIQEYLYLSTSHLIDKAHDNNTIMIPNVVSKSNGKSLRFPDGNLANSLISDFEIYDQARAYHYNSALAILEQSKKLQTKNIDYMDQSSWHFAQAINDLSLENWGIINVANSSKEKSLNNMSIDILSDIFIKYFKVDDILLEANPEEFGFKTLDEKLKSFNTRFGLTKKNSALFQRCLKNYLDKTLVSEQDVKVFLRNEGMKIPYAHSRFFDYYLDRPFTNDELLLHFVQISKALKELGVLLNLLGEEKAKINFNGDFVDGLMTPLTPLLVSVTNISQASLVEILSSSFGSFRPKRPYLIQVVPKGVYSKTTNPVKYNFEKETDIIKFYIKNLNKFGIDFEKKKGFYQTKSLNNKYLFVSKFNVWRQGIIVFKQLARGDFFAKNSKVFSLRESHSSKEIVQMKGFLRKGAGRLVKEGLSLKTQVLTSNLNKNLKEEFIHRIHLEISNLDGFVQKFISFAK